MQRLYDTAVYEIHRLSNGIPVYVNRPPIQLDEEIKISVVLKNIGSCADPQESPGLAHFFEHMPFDGTKSYPSPELLVRPIEKEGGGVGANTSKARTVFYLRTLWQDVSLFIDRLFEIVAHPKFTQENIDREKSVIEQEYFRYHKDPNYVLTSALDSLLYEGHPFSHNIIGTLESIRSIEKNELWLYHSKYYHAGNIAIVCAGSILDPQKLIALLDGFFGAMKAKDSARIAPVPSLPAKTFPVENPDFGRDRACYIYSLPRSSIQEQFAFHSLAEFISGNKYSPLIRELRIKRGWVYESGLVNIIKGIDRDIVDVAFPVKRNNFDEAYQIFLDILSSINKEEYEEYAAKQKKIRRTCFQHPFDTSDSVIGSILRNEKHLSYREREAISNSITLEDILKCRDIILSSKPFIFKALI